MYKITRLFLLFSIIFIAGFSNASVVCAEESDYTTEETGEECVLDEATGEGSENCIYDYNEYYYNSYEEATGYSVNAGNSFAEENDVDDENSTSIYSDIEGVVVCDSIEDAAAYMRECMVNRTDEVEFIYKNEEGYDGLEVFKLIRSILFDETDDYKAGDYLYWNYRSLNGPMPKETEDGLLFELYIFYHSTAEQEKEIDYKVEELLNNEFAGWQNMSEFEKVRRVYRWLTSNYEYVSGEDRHSTYSGMIENETVCQGFATSAYRLLREMGVSCRVVANDEHGWNIVKIGDSYYNIDATWDVGLVETGWNNFLLNNKNFEKIDMHTRGSRFYTEEFNKKYPMSPHNYKWTPEEIGLEYKTHVQTYGWQSYVTDGQVSGTEGEAKRLEAISIHLKNAECYNIDIEYMTHIQSYGWESDWMTSDSVSGTVGKGKRLEAIKIQLNGKMSKLYDVYYRVHVQTYGWLGWAKNGEKCRLSGIWKKT